MSRKNVIGALLLAAASAAGCGGGMQGRYTDSDGFMSIRFESDKAYIKTAIGIETEATYTVDGDRIVLSNADGNMVLTRLPDGTLDGGPAGPFTRTENQQ